MTTLMTPLTELEAVNEILSTGSESPVSTLNDSEVIDASLALRILRTTSVEVQSDGWFFNEEFGVTLAPDISNEIVLPLNLLKIDTSGADVGTPAVQRGDRLYNKTDRTKEFPNGVTVDMVVALQFEELPSTARNYITIRAARKYQDRYFADNSMHGYTAEDEVIARNALRQEDLDSRDPNMLSNTFVTTLQARR